MRLGKKKGRNQPCRSPSPDIVSHSIIKNTVIQVQDIKSKIKKAEEKQIKFQLESSYSLVGATSELNASFQGKYKQLFQEYSRMKLENKQLSEQNKILNSQNKRLSQHQDRQRTFSQITGALLSRNQNQPVLKEKVSNLELDKRNLEKQLNIQKQRNEVCLKSIESLRLQEQLLKSQLNRMASAADGRPMESSLTQRDQEIKFTLFANNLFGSFESTLRNRLNQLNNRINKIEVQQRVIKETHSRFIAESRISKTPSSFKSSRKMLPSTGKAEEKSKDLVVSEYSTARLGYPFSSSSPRMKAEDTLEQIQNQNYNLSEQLKEKSYEIFKLKQEKDRLITSLQQMEKQKSSSSTPKFKESDQNIFKKLNNLQSLVKTLQEENQSLHFENQRLNQLDQHKTSQKNQLLNFIEHQKKIINACENELSGPKQCHLCAIKDIEISQLKDSIRKMSEKHKKDVYDLQQINVATQGHEFQQKQRQGSQTFVDLELRYQKTSKLNQQLFQQLSNVKKMMEYVKEKLEITEISTFLEENFKFYDQLQSEFYSQREQYDRYMLQIRKSLLIKEEQIANLQTKLNLKERQVELLEAQVSKLKEINLQFHSQSMEILKSNLNFMNRDRIDSKLNKFKQNNTSVLDKLRQGTDRISLVHQKVGNSIKIDYSKQFE